MNATEPALQARLADAIGRLREVPVRSLKDAVFDEMSLAHGIDVKLVRSNDAGATYCVSFTVHLDPAMDALLQAYADKNGRWPSRHLRGIMKMGLRACMAEERDDPATAA